MCVSNNKAQFTGTKGYVGEAQTPGGLVHVLGYQNKAQNKVTGPNAMILHFPAKEAMTSANVINLENKTFLKEMCLLVETEISRGKGIQSNSHKVEIFESGAYTVVLSNKPTLINEALKSVPKEKRPDINPELMAWYEAAYPGYSVAVCCFSSDKETDAEQMFWWYKPMNEAELFFPAIDAHDGGVPNLAEKVLIDHTITCSIIELSSEARNIQDITHMHEKLGDNKKFFNDKLLGQSFRSQYVSNGDFVIAKEDLRKGNLNFKRVTPCI